MSALLRLDGVQVMAGGRRLLDVPQLMLRAGERVAIVGPNGAGKSTLLQVMGAWRQVSAGSVRVLGHELGARTDAALTPAQRRALRADVGLLMQGLHLVPRLTARENVLIGVLAALRGADRWRSLLRWYPAGLVAQADAALAELDLAGHIHTRADRLSGGERQKVALARLLLQRPRLVLADEPTAALDPVATAQVCAVLQGLAGEGCALVTVVHDLALLPQLADRVIGMARGQLCWDLPLAGATPARLKALYASTAPNEASDPKETATMTPTARFPLDSGLRHAAPAAQARP